ncbi:DUF1674 domain-containing protein [Silanimonas lenta]|uniref:DUF1674 domain-containing protein n=1 Tax=Silanimonas lenta TaxID=265429 RepID=UPI00056618B8|nr:DUF1674 domain-containing protein [Silanimonas lenta]
MLPEPDILGEPSRETQAPEAMRPDAGGDAAARPREYGGRDGPEPTRFGDWEKNGRCIDF